MKNSIILLVFTSSVLFLVSCGKEYRHEQIIVNTTGRTEILFVNDWRFHHGDLPGAEKTDFSDYAWRILDLPHDWSIEDIPGTQSPFDSTAIGGIDAGYLKGGTGWYRKTFRLPHNALNKQVSILFDGVYMNSDVWLNDHFLGNHPYGYTAFSYDLTPYLKPGKDNVLAVKVNNEGRNSRWYTGSGIYRNVRLLVTGPVAVDLWGQSVTTPSISSDVAKVRIQTKINNKTGNDQHVNVITTIFDKNGKISGEQKSNLALSAAGKNDIMQEIDILKPFLWSFDSPFLYKVKTEVYLLKDDKIFDLLDSTINQFGIRFFSVNTKDGFMLNGLPVKLKGGCMHHDNGPLGAAALPRAEERRVELMKSSGYNAIRCTHNPPSSEFLDACDRNGIIVIDEAFDMWKEEKNPEDYHLYFDEWWQKDIESMVLRDRNHPSVIFWSIGNEIPERAKPEGNELAGKLAGFIRELDPDRLITSAVNSLNPDKDLYFANLDVCGYNYAWENYGQDIKRVPGRIIFSTESFPNEAFDSWMGVMDHPRVIGDFVWTSFDYIGEASIGWRGYPHEGSFFPWNQAYCGDLDICGLKRPQSYYRDVLWNGNNQLSVFVRSPEPSFPLNPKIEPWSKWNWEDVVSSWNWPKYKEKPLEIVVYSSCQEVELLLNRKSLGRKKTSRENKWIATWNTQWEPGNLKAVGYNDSKEVAISELNSAREILKIRMTPDRTQLKADGQDLCFITVELLDNNDVLNPLAEDQVTFNVEGAGSIAAVANSNPMSTESFQQPYRKAWRGKCLVVVRTSNKAGEIKLKASVQGLPDSEISLLSH
jgi:beta-galactosidase